MAVLFTETFTSFLFVGNNLITLYLIEDLGFYFHLYILTNGYFSIRIGE